MILAFLPSHARRLATVGLVAALVAGCSAPMASATPTATHEPTIDPSAPTYTLGPAPTGCPTAAPAAAPAGSTATVTMTTNFGNIVIKVEADLGPNAAGAFLALARCGFYNNIIFHRVVVDFIIQAGDGQYARLPSLTPAYMGTGGTGWTIQDDPVKTTYKRGTIAMARKGGVANSADSQFFIVLDDTKAQDLAAPGYNNYAIFGSVTQGMDVVDAIAAVPLGGEPVSGNPPSMPLVPIVITSTIVTTP